MEPGTIPPMGPQPRFEWRATIPFVNTRFVGLDNGKAILVNVNKLWEAYELRLDLNKIEDRLHSAARPTKPIIPMSFDLYRDRIYRTNEASYLFDYSPNKKIARLLDTVQYTDISLPERETVRPFVSINSDAMASLIMKNERISEYAQFRFNDDWTNSTDQHTISSFTIGDLDSIDRFPPFNLDNGSEGIFFSKDQVVELIHQNPRLQDDFLQKGLNAAIQSVSKKMDTPIQAACISKINNDEYPDFLFMKSGNLYVVSYLGRNWSTIAAGFKQWDDAAIRPIEDETTRYIFVAEITQDSLPDLIIETDKAVHFYRNTAM